MNCASLRVFTSFEVKRCVAFRFQRFSILPWTWTIVKRIPGLSSLIAHCLRYGTNTPASRSNALKYTTPCIRVKEQSTPYSRTRHDAGSAQAPAPGMKHLGAACLLQPWGVTAVYRRTTNPHSASTGFHCHRRASSRDYGVISAVMPKDISCMSISSCIPNRC
jgi:hypothetical protein